MNVKKTTLLIFISLIFVGGAGAYAFSDGVFDEYLDELQNDDDEIIYRKKEVVKYLVFITTDYTPELTSYSRFSMP